MKLDPCDSSFMGAFWSMSADACAKRADGKKELSVSLPVGWSVNEEELPKSFRILYI